jgi:hypothetical protein
MSGEKKCGRRRCWEVANINERGYNGVDWFHLGQNKAQRLNDVNKVMNFWSTREGNVLSN